MIHLIIILNENDINPYNLKTLKLPTKDDDGAVDEEEGTETEGNEEDEDEYKLGEYRFYALLSKVKMEENNVKSQIFQYH